MRFFPNIRADLEAYDGDWAAQGFWAMLVYRFGRWRYTMRLAAVRRPFSMVYKILFKLVQIVCGIELPCEVPVGRRFRIDHFGGIVMSGYARIGDHCILRNGVTIGLKNIEDKRAREREKQRGRPANQRTAPSRLIEGQATTNWKQALGQLAIAYPDRINPYL